MLSGSLIDEKNSVPCRWFVRPELAKVLVNVSGPSTGSAQYTPNSTRTGVAGLPRVTLSNQGQLWLQHSGVF